MIWNILGVIAIICLIIGLKIHKNAIWVGLVIGLLVWLILGFVNWMKEEPFAWWFMGKRIMITFTLLAAIFEFLNRLFEKFKRSS